MSHPEPTVATRPGKDPSRGPQARPARPESDRPREPKLNSRAAEKRPTPTKSPHPTRKRPVTWEPGPDQVIPLARITVFEKFEDSYLRFRYLGARGATPTIVGYSMALNFRSGPGGWHSLPDSVPPAPPQLAVVAETIEKGIDPRVGRQLLLDAGYQPGAMASHYEPWSVNCTAGHPM